MNKHLDTLDHDGPDPQRPPSMPLREMKPGSDGRSTIDQQWLTCCRSRQRASAAARKSTKVRTLADKCLRLG
ncbi:MAG: hypothetical protein JWP59_4619 [Massilia sp.]|nr:hypothetical protein [Massilia sp.]